MAPEAPLPGSGAIELSLPHPQSLSCCDLDSAAPARVPSEPPRRSAASRAPIGATPNPSVPGFQHARPGDAPRAGPGDVPGVARSSPRFRPALSPDPAPPACCAGRPLPHRARARPGRHGHRLPRPRPAARPPGRAQGAPPRARRRRSAPSASCARSASPPGSSTRTSSRVLDSGRGRAGSALVHVMPYVEGESLRDRLRRARAAPGGRRAAHRPRGGRARSTTPTGTASSTATSSPRTSCSRGRQRAGGRLRHRPRRARGRRQTLTADRHARSARRPT